MAKSTTDYREHYRGEKCCATCDHARKIPPAKLASAHDLNLAPYDGDRWGRCSKKAASFGMRETPDWTVEPKDYSCWQGTRTQTDLDAACNRRQKELDATPKDDPTYTTKLLYLRDLCRERLAATGLKAAHLG